jgi:hypothetical protein
MKPGAVHCLENLDTRHEDHGRIPPAEFEAIHYRQATPAIEAVTQ